MIYKKPQFVYDACVNRDSITIIEGAHDLLSFIRSLPDEFEIVEPGMTQVRWPEGLTRERLFTVSQEALDFPQYNRIVTAKVIQDFAAIAPERKKRRVDVIRTKDGEYIEQDVNAMVGRGGQIIARDVEIDD